MKRIIPILLLITLSISLLGCGAATESAVPMATAGDAIPPEALPGQMGAIPEGRSDWAELYTAFAKDHWDTLSSACFGGVAGVGFIDLDLDGTAEMVLFDSGAGASMGVQLFDLVGDQVVCVSASSVETGQAFGTEDLSPLYVDALFFDDFRLVESADGRRWFQVISRNGAGDFYYNELLRLTGVDGVLTLDSLWYKRIATDPATGAEVEAVYTVGGCPVSAETFAAAEENSAANRDTGYTATGMFLWSDKTFGYTREGFLAMVDAAVENYIPVV